MRGQITGIILTGSARDDTQGIVYYNYVKYFYLINPSVFKLKTVDHSNIF